MLNGGSEASAPTEFVSFTDLGERLASPEGPQVAINLEASLRSLGARVDAAAAGGLAPGEFAKAQDISAALQAGLRVLASLRRR